MPREPRIVGGRYRLMARIGAGGMGVVHRARDEVRGADVAVKILHEDDAEGTERFLREAELLARVKHPAVVELVDHGTSEGSPFLVMEWLDGVTLSEALAGGVRPAIEDVLALGRRLGGALAAAHALGIVHRDIKPGNVFLPGRRFAEAKLLDFGIATTTRRSRVLTVQGVLIGTPGYMAPEHARGERLDARADVFALGCVLYECLAGRPAFEGAHPLALLGKLLMEASPRVRDVAPQAPAPLATLIDRMLAKTPSDRPEDGASIVRALEHVPLVAGGYSARPSSPDADRTIALEAARLVGVVMIDLPQSEGDVTLAAEIDVAARDALKIAAAAHGARVEVLPGGSALFVVPLTATAAELAVTTARLASVVSRHLPLATAAASIGRADLRSGRALGQAIEAAGALHARRAGTPGAFVDRAVAALLPTRFELDDGDDGARLLSERSIDVGPRRVLGRATPLVGRRRELATLSATIAEAIAEGEVRTAIVTGAPGLGKSRLLHEAAAEASAFDAKLRVLRGRGDRQWMDAPYATLAHLFSGIDGVEGLGRSEDTGGGALPIDRAAAAAVAAARAMTRETPLLLLVDDVEACDAPSIEVLARILVRLRASPIALVAAARGGPSDRLQALRAHATEIHLGPLGARAQAELVDAMLRGGAPRDGDRAKVDRAVIDRVIARADGTPFVLEELTRAELDGHGDATAPAVDALVHARLSALPNELREALSTVAVFGERWPDAHLPPGDDSFVHALDRLAEGELLERVSGPDGDGWAFRHARVRDVAYELLGDVARRTLHRELAERIASAGAAADAGKIAQHFDCAGEPRLASVHWLRAARRSLAAGDGKGAIATLDRVRVETAALDDAQRVEHDLLVAEARWLLGEVAAAAEGVSRALVALGRDGDPHLRFEALALSARAALVQGRLADVSRVAEEILAASPRLPTMAAVERTLHVGTTCADGGHHALAAALLELAHRSLPALGPTNPRVRASLHQLAAHLARDVGGDLARVVTELSAARIELRALGEESLLAALSLDLAYAELQIGAYDEAALVLEENIALADGLGLARVGAMSRHVLAFLRAERGRWDEAAALSTRAEEDFVAQGDEVMRGGALCNRATMQRRVGDVAAAIRSATNAVEHLARWPAYAAIAFVERARSFLEQGDLAAATADLAEARARQPTTISTNLDVPLALAELACARARGDVGEARTIAQAAAGRLRARAERFADPAARDRFLTGIADHAALIAEADR